MTEINKFDQDFIKRTKQNLEDYKGDYEFTQLINSCLGLIILPFEKSRRNNNSEIWNDSIDNVRSEIDFDLQIFDPKEYDSKKKINKPCEKNFKTFIKKLRNCIAHQRIEPINESGKLVRIKFETEDQDMKVIFDQEQLKNLCFYICDKHLGILRNK